MEPLKNVELPKVEGGLSNSSFESSNFKGLPNYEKKINQGVETLKSREAAFSAMEQLTDLEQVQTLASSQTLPPVNGSNSSGVSQVVSVPATAADTDSMEDEWVKELKRMIIETKNDPFAREVRFKEMQIDYLKKRYNRIINGGK